MTKIYETVVKESKVQTAIKCDCCGRVLSLDGDLAEALEAQEAIRIEVLGGYGSVFGDGTRLSCDFCQQCVKKVLGEYLKEM